MEFLKSYQTNTTHFGIGMSIQMNTTRQKVGHAHILLS